jgi:hypothetical protein
MKLSEVQMEGNSLKLGSMGTKLLKGTEFSVQ